MIVMIVIASLVLAYVITSLLLLRFPHLIHTIKTCKFKAQHISHRGGAGENLENTIGAFKAAYDLGTDMFELDCHLSRDGEVVVAHDDHLLRMTGQDVYISQTDFQDLPSLNESLKVSFEPEKSNSGGSSDRSIPLLKHVFENFPTTPINIDLKQGSEQLISQVSQLVEDYHREHITVWGSQHIATINTCRSQNATIPRFVCVKRAALLVLAFYTGLLPFVPINEQFYEIMMPSIMLKEGRFASVSRTFRFVARLADFLLMNRFMFRHLQRRGLQVYLWVLNDNAEFARALQFGVDGIMTDYPTKLRQFLDNHQNNQHT